MSDYRFNPTTVSAQTPVEVTHSPKGAEPSTKRPESQADWTPQMREYSAVADQARSIPRDELFTELMLVEVPRWMSGLWSDTKNGWRDSRTNTFLSFDAARQLIDARISELGLSPALVHAWGHSVISIAEEQAFYRLPFDQRMKRFKA